MENCSITSLPQYVSENRAPYEGYAIPNYPGSANIFFIPSDIYYTGKAVIESIQHNDNEAVIDASTRFFGIPANIISTGGTTISYGKVFGIITHTFKYLTPITVISGLILCIAEGLVDIFSLMRQRKFDENFDCELLSYFRYMVINIEPKRTMSVVKKITTVINKDNACLEKLLGENQGEIIKNLINKIDRKIRENPELLPTIMNHYRPALEEVSEQLLICNFEKIKHNYLVMSECEKERIEQNVIENNPGLQKEKIQAIQKKELEIALTIKKQNFARRIRTWMAKEVNETITPLLRGIVKGESEAIKEGLQLADDLKVQSNKKKLIHILGIISLIFAAASLIVLFFSCLTFVPYILAAVSMTFALIRAGIFSGMLESRGWTFQPKKLLPFSIRKKLFSNTGKHPEIRHQYQTKFTSEESRKYQEVIHTYRLDLRKRGFESYKENREKVCSFPRLQYLFV